MEESETLPTLYAERIEKEDGRYLIFYTFDEPREEEKEEEN